MGGAELSVVDLVLDVDVGTDVGLVRLLVAVAGREEMSVGESL